MYFLSSNNKTSQHDRDRNPQPGNESIIDRDCGLYKEEYFNDMLRMEEKRAARTGKRVLLMLLDIDRLQEINGINVPKRIAAILATTTRATDIKGWLKTNSIIGVLFTELRESDKNFIRDKIFQKIYKKLSSVLDFEQLSGMEVTFEFFPEESLHLKLNLPRTEVGSTLNLLSSECTDTISNLKHKTNGEARTGVSIQSHEGIPTREEKIEIGVTRHGWFLFLGDFIIILVASLLAAYTRFSKPVNMLDTHAGASILGFVLYPISLYVFDLYNMRRSFKSRETILRANSAIMLGSFFCAFFFYVVPEWQYGRGILLIQMILMMVMTTLWRMLYGAIFQKTMAKIGALVIGAGECGKAIYRLLNSPLSPYEVRGFLDDDPARLGKVIGSSMVLGSVDQLGLIAGQVWAKSAILTISRNCQPKLIRRILEARLQGIEILEMPTIYEKLTGRVPVRHVEDQWLLFADGFYLISKEYIQKVKRIVDITISGFLLLCFAPLMAVTALLIKLDSPGPILYRQDRVGKGGRIFSVTKFRSMHQDAESQGAQWAEKKDPRVTRVGRWIRLFRIDEIPQIWNVFKGDMTLVGPRPERPEFVAKLEERIPYYGARHAVSPGITGWAQVNYPYGSSVGDALNKLEYDLFYIKNMSLFLDLKILLKTVGVVLSGEGAR